MHDASASEHVGAAEPARARRVDPVAVVIATLVGWVPIALFVTDTAAIVVRLSPLIVVGALLSGFGLALTAIAGWRWGVSASRHVAGGYAVVLLSTFLFGRWLSTEPASAVSGVVGLLLWLGVTTLVAVLVARVMVHKGARQFLVITLALVLVLSVVTAGSVGLQRRGTASLAAEPFVWPDRTVPTPNIYWFVLDQHARPDQLQQLTGADGTWFDDELTDRGFAVSTSSNAAYPHTHLSLASTLLMAYPWTDRSQLPEGADARAFDLVGPVLRGHNPVVSSLRDLGYDFVYAPAGPFDWGSCDPDVVDRCLTGDDGAPWATDPIRALLASTPLPLVWGHGAGLTPMGVVDGLQAEVAAGDVTEPFFLFAHVLSPHEPFRYGEDCALLDRWRPGTNLTGSERAAAYVNEVRCLDAEVVAAVDRIQAADPDAIIIVQSDHGTRLTFDWTLPLDRWTQTNLDERFGVVNAMRLPGDCGDDVEGASLVNTFRIVLACVAGTEPDLLESRAFYTGFNELRSLTEVTDRLR